MVEKNCCKRNTYILPVICCFLLLFPSLLLKFIFIRVSLNQTEKGDATSGTASLKWMEQFKILCYYSLPPNESSLQPEAIDPYLCTHIVVGFAQVLNNTIQPNSKKDPEIYNRVLLLKRINPSLKILLSIGQQGNNIWGFSRAVAHQNHRIEFAKNCLMTAQQFGFDGIDIDWEFPSWPQADQNQKLNFTHLLTEIRNQFNGNNKTRLLLTVAVSASENIMNQSYDIPGIAEAADFINLMAYDFHIFQGVFPVTGPNAPLYPRPIESGLIATLNTNWSAVNWCVNGVPKEKLLVGIPTFGHSFMLVNEDNSGWSAPASGFGSIGRSGFINEDEACSFIAHPITTHIFDDDYKVPYAYNGKDWISYENTESVMLKTYYIKNNQFAGAMIYSLNSDDFLGKCGKEKFILTRKVSNILSSPEGNKSQTYF